MSENEIHGSGPIHKMLSANIPTVLTVLSAIMTALVGGYVAIATKNMDSREQHRIAEIQSTAQQKTTETQTTTQKSIAEMQKDAQQAITQEQLKAQLAIADKQSQAQKDVTSAQRDTERYMSDARIRTDAEIARLSEDTKTALGRQQNSVERAKLFSGLINDLADLDPHKSSVALLVLWQLYQGDDERNVIIATALAIGNQAILPTLEMLGNTDKRGLALIEHYSNQGTPQQKTIAKIILGAISFTGPVATGQRAELEAQIKNFQEYLRDLGFANVSENVNVEITAEDNAYYGNGTMTLGRNIARDQNIVLREYAHHILVGKVSGENIPSSGYAAIESGLASYFACSHTENSVSTWRGSDRTSTIPLENNDKLSALNSENVSNMGARVWGGIFWEVRKLLGKNAADKLMFQTASSFRIHSGMNMLKSYRDFATLLLEIDKSIEGGKNQLKLRSILEARGLKL